MYEISTTKAFEKDLVKKVKNGFNANELATVIDLLRAKERLPVKYNDHKLVNCKEFPHCKECHVRPDLLLVYRINKVENTLLLYRFGTHTELFG